VGRDDDFSSSMGDNGFRAFTPEPMSEEKLKPAQAEATEEKLSELTDDELDGVAGGVESLSDLTPDSVRTTLPMNKGMTFGQ
jgi:hypothetical protein